MAVGRLLLREALAAAIAAAAVHRAAALAAAAAPAGHAPGAPARPARHLRRRLGLLATSSGTRSTVKDTAGRADPKKTVGWFGSFGEAETTYSDEGLEADIKANPARVVEFGWERGFAPPGGHPYLEPYIWFQETPSAGAKGAWQTYPAVQGGVGSDIGDDVFNNRWRETPEGLVQNYNGFKIGMQGPEWFDSSALNYDGYGREVLPYPETPKRFLDAAGQAWVERAVNTTVACPSIGCVANATLAVFDRAKEEARNCRINIGVHPTDFDNDWSRENIEVWTLNGYVVRATCDPRAQGCNNAKWRQLYSCLSEFPVDHLMNSDGTLLVEGKLSKMVDECPYNGNLLSGVATVTCLVRSRESESREEDLGADANLGMASTTFGGGRLHCSSPGCTAIGSVRVDPQIAMLGGTCLMNISVAQTDFDDGLGAPEEVEFVSVEGVGNVVSHMKPGYNPCASALGGKPLSEEDRNFTLLVDYNVTEQVLAPPAGVVRLKGKISEHVDECASDGSLFDAYVSIHCE